MLSKKMAFSLTSLITILALAFVVPSALAAPGGPTVTITAVSGDKDKSTTDVIDVSLVEAGTVDDASDDTFDVTIKFSDPVDVLTIGTDDTSRGTDDIIVTNIDSGVEIDYEAVRKNSQEYTVTITPGEWDADADGSTDDVAVENVRVYVKADMSTSIGGDTIGKKNQLAAKVFKVITTPGMPGSETPYPVRIKRLAPTSGFMTPKVSGPFDVKIVLSEQPKDDKFTAGHIGTKNATVGDIVFGGPIARWKYLMTDEDETRTTYHDADNNNNLSGAATAGATYDTTAESIALNPQATGAGAMFYRYKVAINPDLKKDEAVTVWVKDFEDNEGADPPEKYRHDALVSGSVVKSRKVPDALSEGKEKLTVSVDLTSVVGTPEAAGKEVSIPNDTIIPAGGYLIVAKDDGEGDDTHEKRTDSTYIIYPGNPMRSAPDPGKQQAQHLYHMVKAGLPYDLEGFLIRGGTIDLIAPAAGVVITEIMWATDAGSSKRQWIEIKNISGARITVKDYKLTFYTANEALPDMAATGSTIRDRMSTLYKGTNHWSIAGRGQSGRIQGKIETKNAAGEVVDVEIVPTDRLISMERVMAADDMYADGTMASSWAQSVPPSSNFVDAAGGLFVGSPGADPINPVADPVPEPEAEPTPPVAVAMKDDIMITEIMVDTGGGRLPQWIELTNVSGAEKSLAGWSIEIENTAADADAIASSISINLSGTLGVGGGEDAGGTMGKSLLLVAGAARSSSNLSGSDRVVDISAAVAQKGRYTLLSTMGFMITLVPPQTTGIVQYGDMAGNLDAAEAWEIEMSENGRSSLIRREMLADGMATMGTDANGWVLASGTSLVSGPATWYGSDEDAGTPGYDGGGPLPVELSHFRPARDKATGAVVITWATQSELNNAGFFIKRSNQRDGQFQVINATMIAGAGTTSEKQFYTYTDTTAQPNVVYYYQIEDVSLDGNRQTLTNGIRLKGHIGAAGKLTTTWGELKTSHE